ncbi:MAG TPA: DUF1634 domain-containing protein [Terracidiphilus sp.]|nr:DUF1634 domain-containing protein [Terracidiphilus sp.]
MDDRRLELMIGNLLRIGVTVAAAIVLLGGTVYLAHHATEPVSYHTFIPGPEKLRTLGGIVQSAAHFESQGLIQFGLLLLIATPIARVVFAVVGFQLERDRLYVAISLVVLTILIFSLLHAA